MRDGRGELQYLILYSSGEVIGRVEGRACPVVRSLPVFILLLILLDCFVVVIVSALFLCCQEREGVIGWEGRN